MGNSQTDLRQSLQFTQILEDEKFGDIEIYKSRDGKFVMKNARTFVVNDQRYEHFQKQVKCQQSVKDSRTVIPLLYLHRKINKNLCIDY